MKDKSFYYNRYFRNPEALDMIMLDAKINLTPKDYDDLIELLLDYINCRLKLLTEARKHHEQNLQLLQKQGHQNNN